jgi:hypothetical protein
MPSFRHVALLSFVVASLPLSAQAPTTPPASARATPRPTKLLPGTHSNVLSTIHGNALTSTNTQLADAPVRLRDARSGRIVETQVTDKGGMFSFSAIEPGNYIVEVMSADDSTVLTASQILTVDAGDVISAVVKLPFHVPPFGGVMAGHAATTPSMAALAAQAASSGIVAVTTSGDPTCPIQ